MSETEINGWKPPLIYDASTGIWRIATQNDIDNMAQTILLLGGFFADIRRRIDTVSTELKSHRQNAG